MLLRTQCKTFCTHIHVDVRIMQHRHSFDVEDSQGILKDDVTMIAPIDNLKAKKQFRMFYYRKLNIRISLKVLFQFVF